jgi:hypothetical protein
VTISEERQQERLPADGAERPAPRHRPRPDADEAAAFVQPEYQDPRPVG